MTVYIDDAFIPHKGKTWCHLMADSDQELEAFARRIGFPVSWKHGDHYDVVAGRRQQAIKNGAESVTVQKIVEVRRKLRREAKVK